MNKRVVPLRASLILMPLLILGGCHIRYADDGNSSANAQAPANVTAADNGAMPAGDMPPPADNMTISNVSTGNMASPTSASAPAATGESGGQAALDVLTRYYGFIRDGEYGDAWALWDRDGAASGKTEAEFAASFAKYATYTAAPGTPGQVDAGAGNRYVTIPVHISGTLKDGNRPFAEVGLVTLHRTGDVPGATEAQKSWRLYQADIKPVPAEAQQPAEKPPQEQVIAAQFACVNGSKLTAIFDNTKDIVTIRKGDKDVAVMAQQQSADGMFYETDNYVLRGKGRQITFSTPDSAPLPCTQMGK